ncbi:hypothetical protein KL909_004463 [Ogataea angusta]|nr:hypothetical protein KL909_004463 [Ogataea angusta]
MVVPTKRLRTPEDLAKFQHSAVYNDMVQFVVDLAKSVHGLELGYTDNSLGDNIGKVLQLLEKINSIVDNHPVVKDTSSRFGKPEFRDFYDELATKASGLVQGCAGEEHAEELGSYLLSSFGDRTRIDYGLQMGRSSHIQQVSPTDAPSATALLARAGRVARRMGAGRLPFSAVPVWRRAAGAVLASTAAHDPPERLRRRVQGQIPILWVHCIYKPGENRRRVAQMAFANAGRHQRCEVVGEDRGGHDKDVQGRGARQAARGAAFPVWQHSEVSRRRFGTRRRRRRRARRPRPLDVGRLLRN